MISYERLRILMVKSRMEWKDLQVIFGFSPYTIRRLKRNELVDLETLIKLCTWFNCQLEEIVEIKIIDENDVFGNQC